MDPLNVIHIRTIFITIVIILHWSPGCQCSHKYVALESDPRHCAQKSWKENQKPGYWNSPISWVLLIFVSYLFHICFIFVLCLFHICFIWINVMAIRYWSWPIKCLSQLSVVKHFPLAPVISRQNHRRHKSVICLAIFEDDFDKACFLSKGSQLTLAVALLFPKEHKEYFEITLKDVIFSLFYLWSEEKPAVPWNRIRFLILSDKNGFTWLPM